MLKYHNTMSYFFADGIFVVYHDENDPQEEEWQEFVTDSHRAIRVCECSKILIYSDGGGPDGDQRKDLADFHEKWAKGSIQEPRLAVITTSAFAALAANMISFMVSKITKKNRIKFFNQREQGYDFLSLTTEDIVYVEGRLEMLKNRCNV